MPLTNIIDRRTRPYRYLNINAIIEPTWHDNACKDADYISGSDTWIGYAERQCVALHEAIEWANGHDDSVTLFLYDEADGLTA
jgi:hypothetical protein